MIEAKKRSPSVAVRSPRSPWAQLAATVFALAVASCIDTGVEPPRATRVEITPYSATISTVGYSVTFRADVRDQYGHPFVGPVIWSGDADDVFVVDGDGVATAVGIGAGKVWATVGTATASADLRVVDPSIAADGHTGVCDRTPQVRDAILAALEMGDCSAVTDVQLASIRILDVSGPRTVSSFAPCERRVKKRDPTPDEVVRMEHYDCDGTSTIDGSLSTDGFASTNSGFAQPGPLDPILVLKADDFAGLSGVLRLDLSGNHLLTLPEGVFDGLTSLVQLLLYNNRLTGLPEGVFDGLTSLRWLQMDRNRLASLPDGAFDGLVSLERLIMTSNRIAGLPDGAFDDLTSLRWLYMSGNRIPEIPEGAFDNLGNLQRLHMGANQISEIPEGAFDNLVALQRLLIYSNQISEIPEGAFDNLANLQWLYVYLNDLDSHSLPDGVFDALSSLQELDMDGNNVVSLPDGIFDNLSQLQTLWINRNGLKSLPDGIFDNLSRLRVLWMNSNMLTSLPDGLFEGLDSLRLLTVENNPGGPFPLELALQRTDNDDALAPGPATVSISLALGAPFPMQVGLAMSGALASQHWLTIDAGDTRSSATLVRKPIGSGFASSVRTATLPEVPPCSLLACFLGFKIVASDPLVLANPRRVRVEAPSLYLNQAAQNLDGTVPLIAGRQAILRVFGTGDDVNNLRPAAKAMFYRDGEIVHSVDLDAPPNGIPTEVDESRLSRSFNAMIPGEVLMPGTEIVVDLDTEGTLPLGPGSMTRVPRSGTMPLNVVEVPPLNVTVVPVQYAWEPNAVFNDGIMEASRRLVEEMPEDLLYPTLTRLPVREVNLTLREPYYTWADTMAGAGFALLEEVELLRHLEAAGTTEYYHGIFAWPRYATWDSWGFGGVAADIPSYTALSLWYLGNGAVYSGFASTFAHELGHNLSLRHAPCGGAGGPDPFYPYANASVGTWGYNFGRAGQSGTLVDPMAFRDHMSYCGPEWVSDYFFAKSLVHLVTYGRADARARRAPMRRTLLLSGGVHDGALRLGLPFVWQAQPRLPQRSGRYAVTGFDASGRQLFSLSFEPGAPNDMGGRSFMFAVPYRPEWDQALEQIVLQGPEGFVAIDRSTIDQTAVVADRTTGRIRSIVPDWSGDVPAAMGRAAQFSVSRGLQGTELR